jgi:16S rRNA (guanine527-N7)-methyltransferase
VPGQPGGEPGDGSCRQLGVREHLVRVVLAEAQASGFLGPGPLDPQVAHAELFAAAYQQVAEARPDRVLDLGSGGGLPGLVLAARWSGSRFVLLEGSARRAAFLQRSLRRLPWGERVVATGMRAEEAARQDDLRSSFQLVVARSFAAPAVTAECAAGFLSVGGWLIVSEPPAGGASRWPALGVAQVGLSPAVELDVGARFCAMRQDRLCPDRYPRRVGIPGKRPLF